MQIEGSKGENVCSFLLIMGTILHVKTIHRWFYQSLQKHQSYKTNVGINRLSLQRSKPYPFDSQHHSNPFYSAWYHRDKNSNRNNYPRPHQKDPKSLLINIGKDAIIWLLANCEGKTTEWSYSIQ